MSRAQRSARPRTSTRDPDDLRARLERWLARQLPAESSPRVAALSVPPSNGMSSETLLLDLVRNAGAPKREALVVRVAPDPAAVPVFPHYDLPRQAGDARGRAQEPHWMEGGAMTLRGPAESARSAPS